LEGGRSAKGFDPTQQLRRCHLRRLQPVAGLDGGSGSRCRHEVYLVQWVDRHALIVRQSRLHAKCAAVLSQSPDLESAPVNLSIQTPSNKSAQAIRDFGGTICVRRRAYSLWSAVAAAVTMARD